MKTNDLDWIIQNDSEIEYYLGDVTTEQFKADIKALMAKASDKQAIKEAIKKLQELV